MTMINFSDELTAISQYLEAAQEVIRSGFMPDITTLERRVTIVCEALQQTKPAARSDYVARLSAILQQINTLEAAMRSFHESHQKTGSAHA
jgi:ABC-type Zn uptake system ZnuABC Zn-binding protein ZnuA